MRKRCLLGCLLIVLIIGKSAGAQDVDPALESDVIKLLDVLNVTKNFEQIAGIVAQQMIEGVRRAHPEVPERALAIANNIVQTRFAESFSSPNGLMSKIVPIYVKYFTREDVAAMIAFYQSDTGRKTVTVLPSLFRDSSAIGQQWAAELMPKIQTELENRLRAEQLVK